MSKTTFGLMTDFGFDFSVASMKALILKELPSSQIVDIDHNIKQFSVLSGAFVIRKVYEYFPEGTIFVCVIDPGVGSKREPISLDLGGYTFVGPNNGLFHYLIKKSTDVFRSYSIKNDFRPDSSNTFHGRDLFTPAAIEVARENLDILEPMSADSLVTIDVLDKEESLITYIDSFGNIKTNVPFDVRVNGDDYLTVKIDNTVNTIKVVTTFSDVKRGELLCYKGSNGTLEVAANQASAADILQATIGDRLLVE
jgi:S-adenosylmethionine hydrolase